jgi:hypothetical protein
MSHYNFGGPTSKPTSLGTFAPATSVNFNKPKISSFHQKSTLLPLYLQKSILIPCICPCPANSNTSYKAYACSPTTPNFACYAMKPRRLSETGSLKISYVDGDPSMKLSPTMAQHLSQPSNISQNDTTFNTSESAATTLMQMASSKEHTSTSDNPSSKP